MSQLDSGLFPSPDHTYAISPVKEETQEPAPSNGLQTEAQEPQEEEEQTPTYRGRVSEVTERRHVMLQSLCVML